jgi:hypothetical protein
MIKLKSQKIALLELSFFEQMLQPLNENLFFMSFYSFLPLGFLAPIFLSLGC